MGNFVIHRAWLCNGVSSAGVQHELHKVQFVYKNVLLSLKCNINNNFVPCAPTAEICLLSAGDTLCFRFDKAVFSN